VVVGRAGKKKTVYLLFVTTPITHLKKAIPETASNLHKRITFGFIFKWMCFTWKFVGLVGRFLSRNGCCCNMPYIVALYISLLKKDLAGPFYTKNISQLHEGHFC